MKLKISISIEEQTLKQVENEVAKGVFRNKSHFIELATRKELEKQRE